MKNQICEEKKLPLFIYNFTYEKSSFQSYAINGQIVPKVAINLTPVL